MKICYSIIYTLLLTATSQAQSDSSRLSSNFSFEDGIYFTIESLVSNRADISWVGVDGEMVELPASQKVQIAGFGFEGKAFEKPVFAIAFDGKPYILVKHNEGLNYHEFAGLRELGHFSYYEYQDRILRGQTMYAYNPSNGQPFRQGYIETDRLETIRRCIDMTTGRQFPLKRADLLIPLSPEPEITRAISMLDSNDPTFYERLLQAVVRFNERHPVFLPRPTIN